MRCEQDQKLTQFRVDGKSMWPVLQPGDVVRIRDDLQRLKTGQIVVHRDNENELPIIHRVISVSNDSVRTKGDRSMISESIRTIDIQGIVVEIKRQGSGSFVSFKKSAFDQFLDRTISMNTSRTRPQRFLNLIVGWARRSLLGGRRET